MKKFISLVMAGAMVLSLVPATAFAKGDVTATAKVVDAWKKSKGFDGKITGNDAPELQLKVSSVDYQVSAGQVPTAEVTVSLDNAKFIKLANGNVDEATIKAGITVTEATTAAAISSKYNYTKVALESDTTELQALLKDYYDNGTDLKNTLRITAAAVGTAEGTATAAVGSSAFTFATNGGAPFTTAGMYASSPAVQMDAALNTYLGITAAPFATFSDYSFVAVSGAYGNDVYVKNMGATGPGPAYFSRAAFLTSAGKSSMDDFTGAKVAYATWETSALAALQGGTGTIGTGYGLYKENATLSTGTATGNLHPSKITLKEVSEDQLTIKIEGFLTKDTIISMNLFSVMDSVSEGKKATVSVDSKLVTANDLVYASVLGKGLSVSVKKTVDVAEEEKATLNSNGVKIGSTVGDFVTSQKFELKLSKGFEFSKVTSTAPYTFGTIDGNEVTVTYTGAGTDEFTIDGDDIEIEATSAKSGSVATLTVKSVYDKTISGTFSESASCEVAKVVDYKVNLTVDEDEDVPVIFSGVNVDNDGITDDSDHLSLEVTAKETFPGAWSMRQGFNFNLPDGVYVTDVNVKDADNFKKGIAGTTATTTDWETAFANAYKDGDHKNFEFGKRVFNDVDTVLATDPAELTFQLELVADPTFEGDVVLSFEGALVDTQTVTIAKFVKPYTVKAEQNDVIIDYRDTEVKTPIEITEAEAGLLEKGTIFSLSIEDNLISFDGDPEVAADDASEMTIKDDDTINGTFVFKIDDESDAAAVITISDMKLFMSRSIPAGAYDLKISTTMDDAYDEQGLFAPDEPGVTFANRDKSKESFVDDVCDYSTTVKEAFINVVTSGRDQDNLFTTKVVVPVGEGYLVAGETKITLDAPAYISAAGYTMLPVRAVSSALGVDTNNVLWSAETKTVTIMFAQRIISMTVGQKTVYVNGSAIPTSAAPEIKDGRTFLPLRDLGTALGVTNVSWDSATKTATLN